MAVSDSFRFPARNFIKKDTPAKMFSVNFAEVLRTSFDRTRTDLGIGSERKGRTGKLVNVG